MVYKVLGVLMDEAYANEQFAAGNRKERESLDLINSILPQFKASYDTIIDLRDWSSVTEDDQKKRIDKLKSKLLDVRSKLDSLRRNREDVSLYIHFVGHGGHNDSIDEIQHIHYDLLFFMIEHCFDDYTVTINLLGTCQSKYAKKYMKRGTLLCCSKSTFDVLSPFHYTSLGYYETGDIEGFKLKCGNLGGYEKLMLP